MNNTTISDFYCTKCGKKGIPIARKAGKQREAGHLKKLYCIYCQEETNHVEIRPFGEYNYENFIEEFKAGRFVDGNRIELKDLAVCSKENCPYNKNQKCWNANHSFLCLHRLQKEVYDNVDIH